MMLFSLSIVHLLSYCSNVPWRDHERVCLNLLIPSTTATHPMQSRTCEVFAKAIFAFPAKTMGEFLIYPSPSSRMPACCRRFFFFFSYLCNHLVSWSLLLSPCYRAMPPSLIPTFPSMWKCRQFPRCSSSCCCHSSVLAIAAASLVTSCRGTANMLVAFIATASNQ